MLFIALMVITVVVFKIYTTNYYRADISIIENIESVLSGEVHSFSDKNGTVFLPVKTAPKAVIVFYPGGKVEYTSYNGLMFELASRGYICLLPKMPENLAVLKMNAVDTLTEGYSDYTSQVSELDWYLAGHSLGGVAACNYLEKHSEQADDSNNSESKTWFKGIILCASYPSTDLSHTDYRLLSIYGSHDGVLDMKQYEESKRFWPENSEEKIIAGGIHSYFGSYGLQDNDGEPSISNYEQITQTADIIADWVSH